MSNYVHEQMTNADNKAQQDDVADLSRFNPKPTTLVWFGGHHEPHINPNPFRAANIDVVSFTEDNLDWYLGGVPGLADTWDQSMAMLRERLSGRRIVTGGSSAGGYAALRAAIPLKASKCIAFAPQTGALDSEPKLLNLIDVYESESRIFPISLHLSRSETAHKEQFFWDDWGQIAGLQDRPGVKVTTHPFDYHYLTVFLAQAGQFYPLLLEEASPDPRAS